MTTQNFLRDFIVMAILIWSASSGLFLESQRKRLQKGNTNMVLYGIGSIAFCLLILWYSFIDRYAPEYIDSLFYWLWLPALCLCLFLVLEARFHIREKLCYSVRFWKKGARRLVFFAGGCLGVCLLVWYGYRINQMLFRQEYYQPVLEEHQIKETGTGLQIPWMVEGDYVVSQNQKQEKIFPFSRQKIYFQFFSKKQRAGEDLHLELLHHGTWYRLQEKEGAEEPKPSEREWLPQSAEQYYALELGDFFGVIPGYYRLCMAVEEMEEVEYLETYFWIK